MTVEGLPQEVAVPPQGETDVLVVIRNGSGERLKDLELSWFTRAGVKVSAAAPFRVPALEPFGEVARTLQVSRVADGPARGEIYLHLDYVWARQGSGVSRVAVAALKVTPLQPDAVEQVASVEVKSSMKSVVEHRPGHLYLVVTNTSNVPVDVFALAPSAPGFLSVRPERAVERKALRPRDTFVIPYEVKAAGELEPIRAGKHLLLFQVLLRWESNGRRAMGTLVATHETDVGVLGESEILTVMGIPTFLVLPGFLMVVTFTLLWNRVSSPSGQEREKLALEKTSPELWLISVTLSILAALLYPWITDLLGPRRNYLQGYGLADVVWIWTGSVLLAALAFAVMWSREKRKAKEGRELTFVEGDLPLEVLRKLSRQQAGLSLPGVVVALDGEELSLFLLQSSGNRLWVAPPILLNGLDRVEDGLKGQILAQLDDDGDPGQLADLLEGAPQISPDWRSSDGRIYPISVERSAQRGDLSSKTVLALDPENEVD